MDWPNARNISQQGVSFGCPATGVGVKRKRVYNPHLTSSEAINLHQQLPPLKVHQDSQLQILRTQNALLKAKICKLEKKVAVVNQEKMFREGKTKEARKGF